MNLTRLARKRGDSRSEAQIREHYRIERELADRLRTAPAEQRARLYVEIYDELFRRVSHHPQLQTANREAAAAERRRTIAFDLRFIGRFLRRDSAFLEIGAGDCALSLKVAELARRVHATEVSRTVARPGRQVLNFELHLTEGTRIPLADASVDVAFSDQLIEHLHPDDAHALLREAWRCLVPGGVCLCITPNRLYGPRDVSEYFDQRATGLHLREYSAREIRQLFIAAGFARTRFYAGARGHYLRVPYVVVALAERLLECLPPRWCKAIADVAPMRALLGLRVVGMKSG